MQCAMRRAGARAPEAGAAEQARAALSQWTPTTSTMAAAATAATGSSFSSREAQCSVRARASGGMAAAASWRREELAGVDGEYESGCGWFALATHLGGLTAGWGGMGGWWDWRWKLSKSCVRTDKAI
ncbi:hypothetical protein DM02DRAFT_35809 [Periconia macrospinosa]|uniref:Uncharacterized protein n=1 Tax=Periconia macrospinosa TaxID=97972 RepID=A0A2V1EA87_9PLEO|nr:hypothetical protein DM02DRAFT_35809 [Periconia macrospinosa]